jgi:cell fate (sporulation/competence/biofilm development) regulator YlbF (YheA/YmcA/DUF963 family)
METVMETDLENSIITRKTKELCQAILDQPEFQTIRQRIDTFMADENVKTLYHELSEKGALLQHKQQTGMPLDGQEITDFEQKRESFLNNPVAQGFLDAQQAMHGVQESVTQYVSKTFELGRLPRKEDFEDGSCGHGCGCSH